MKEPPFQFKAPLSHNFKTANGYKSFHYLAKKIEAERIDIENKRLIDRLIAAHGTIRVNELENDFKKAVMYKKRAQYNGAQSVTKVIENRRRKMESVQSQYLDDLKSIDNKSSKDEMSVSFKNN